jgi:PqqD family protein of HPr-rel-A system
MRWAVSPSVVWSESGDEIRLYDTVSGDFQTLNATGTAIWRRIADTGDQDAVVAALADEFGAQDDNQRQLIASDTERFIRGLADRGLIVEQPSGAALTQ